MKILHISYSYDFTDGGITTVVKEMIKEQEKANLSVKWLASKDYVGNLRKKEFLEKIYEINPSVIHLHGLWRLHTRVTRNFVKKGIPYVITPAKRLRLSIPSTSPKPLILFVSLDLFNLKIEFIFIGSLLMYPTE